MKNITTRHIISLLCLCAVPLLALDCTDMETNNQGAGFTPSESHIWGALQVVEDQAVDGEYSRYVVGIVKNNSKKHYGYVRVDIDLYNQSGRQVGSTIATTDNLEPYGIWRFKADILEDSAKKFKIKSVKGF